MILKRVFADMEPIPQDDGPRSVCAIDYPLAYQEAMGYLRAVLRADEQSGKSLKELRMVLKNTVTHKLYFMCTQHLQ